MCKERLESVVIKCNSVSECRPAGHLCMLPMSGGGKIRLARPACSELAPFGTQLIQTTYFLMNKGRERPTYTIHLLSYEQGG